MTGAERVPSARPVAALFVLPSSAYKALELVDCYDALRDARTFPGGCPVVAHPPCGPWGGLRNFCRASAAEKALGPLAAELVRANGGVLEHPAGSSLFAACAMPRPGWLPDAWGGWTMEVEQSRWGFPCAKRTWLYFVGVRADALPPLPPPRVARMVIGRPRGGVERYYGRHLPKSQRSVTTAELAAWLVDVARRCEVHHG